MAAKLSLEAILNHLLTIGLIVVCYLQVGYLLADKPLAKMTSNKLYPVFEQKPFRRAIEKIDQRQKVVVRGQHNTGLYLFLDYYANKKIMQGYSVRKRQVSGNSQLSFESGGILSLGWVLLEDMLFPNDLSRQLWIIDVKRQLTLGEHNRIHDFGENHPNVKLIFVEGDMNQKVTKLPVVQVPAVARQAIQKTLEQHGFSKGMLDSLFELYGGDLEVIDNEVNLDNFEKAMLENLAVEVARIRRIEEQSVDNALVL